MGILTDFFAANDEELARVLGHGGLAAGRTTLSSVDVGGEPRPAASRERLFGLPVRRMKNIDDVPLNTLCTALGVGAKVFADAPLHEEGNGAVRFFKLPDALIAALAAIGEPSLPSAGKDWASALRADFATIADEATRNHLIASIQDEIQEAILRQLWSLAVEAGPERKVYVRLVS